MILDTSKCARKAIDIHGQVGLAWLEQLPRLVATYAERWSLSIQPPFNYDSYGYVCPAVRDGEEEVVPKLCIPNRELTCQIESLRIADGDGMVRLLESEPEEGVVLLERAMPGTMLAALDDDEQITEIAAQLMMRLWKPVRDGHSFPTVVEWASDLEKIHRRFSDGYGPFPPRLINLGKSLFQDLLSTGETPLLIHGDVNPFNILRASRVPWLVIDPKGVVGNPLYDVATFLNNLPEDCPPSEARPILARRIDQMSEILGFPKQLIHDWGLAHCILAGYWTFEDHGDGWQIPFSFAEIYEMV